MVSIQELNGSGQSILCGPEAPHGDLIHELRGAFELCILKQARLLPVFFCVKYKTYAASPKTWVLRESARPLNLFVLLRYPVSLPIILEFRYTLWYSCIYQLASYGGFSTESMNSSCPNKKSGISKYTKAAWNNKTLFLCICYNVHWDTLCVQNISSLKMELRSISTFVAMFWVL